MEVCIVGAGYVGLTSAAVLANFGHTVYCVDTNEEKIQLLNRNIIPIYEPGLEEMIVRNKTRLTFTVNVSEMISRAAVVYIAVGTPAMLDGQTDLSFIHSVIGILANSITSYKTIITKSTVPPGTNENIYTSLLQRGVDKNLFNVVSNPEFLREGQAIYDMMNADKIVVGKMAEDTQSLAILKELYKQIDAPYVVTSLTGAEMIKYASNAFLATKISFINEMAKICDKYEVNIEDVSKGIGLDPRINPHFLQAGLGYGGSCFPKDVRSLEHSALKKDIKPDLLQAVQAVNQKQVYYYIEKMVARIPDFMRKQVTVLGIAFKPRTDDIRFSPAHRLIEKLSEWDVTINTYDPKASLQLDKENVVQYDDVYEAIKGSYCVIIATDWQEFQELNWEMVQKLMVGNWIVDGRNCLDPEVIKRYDLSYVGVGRP